ncbi:MAG: signal peptidase I [Desulfovibrio sp.]|jgi:signal peptidase I|nr:signal peptidase I [Desulfovibrio sp.]
MSLNLSGEKKKSVWREYAEALFLALLLALFIRSFLVQAFRIPSESMVSTLLAGDHLLASKCAYGIRLPFTNLRIYQGEEPVRGDIIIFKYPNDPSVDYIKRVVGVPGDVVAVCNKQLYRNGQPVRENYVRFTNPSQMEPVRDNFGPVTVPEGKYFVMGDNRDNSLDSRFWGFVDRNSILAKAWRIYWSWEGISDIRLDRIGMLIR